MSRPGSSQNVQLNIGGNVSGQIAIGDNILQIGEIHGGIVNIVAPPQKPKFSHQARPVYIRPHAFNGLLDRARELGTTVAALEVPESVSIHGPNGLGKTALLRYLAYNSPENRFPDGIVYFSARGANVADLLQNIFESFYESDQPAKPTHAQLCQMLQSVRALILLDDAAWTRDEISELINSVPQCAFIFASTEPCLWGEGRCIPLDGLPVQEALTLIERELGRRLAGQERSSAEAFCQTSKGHPLLVIQAAVLVHQGKTFAEAEERLCTSEEASAKATLTGMTDSQRRVLSVLAALGNFPINLKHLAALSQSSDFDIQFKALLDRHLVQANSPAYNLTGSLAFSLERVTDLSEWQDLAIAYFVQWIKQNPPLPDITDVLNLLLSLLEKANRENRWDDVIALGRGIEKALVLTKRWQAWLQVLEWILRAARLLGDRTTEGWALHQLGTRSLCLGDLGPARHSLTEALKIREALGDKAGAAVTRHNLNLIIPPAAAPPRETPRSKPRPGPKAGGSPVLKAVVGFMGITLVVIVGALIWLFLSHPPSPPTVNPPPAKTERRLPSPTRKPVTQRPPTEQQPGTEPPTEPPTESPVEPLPPQVCAPGVWYCENFDDGVAQDFDLGPGWFAGSNVLEGTGHHWATLMNHGWENYRLTFRLNLMEGTIHLVYRHTPENGPIRYFIGFSQNRLSLTKQVRDDFTDLASVEAYHSLNEWHTVEIAGWGGHIAVYVDGKLELQAMDERFISGGIFAFETMEYSRAQIDDIEVKEPGEEPAMFQPFVVTAYLRLSCESTGKTTEVTTEYNTDRMGNGLDYWDGAMNDPDTPNHLKACQDRCRDDNRCQAYTFREANSYCWLKEGIPDPTPADGLISGIKVCK